MVTSWSWSPRELGPPIGIVTSGARASSVPVRISRRAIDIVRDEMLVIVDDYFEDRRFLGCLRNSVKLDIAIDSAALPTTFEPEHSSQYAAPVMNAVVEIVGELSKSGGLETTFAIPRPGSVVYLVSEGSKLPKVLRVPQGLVVGRHKFSGLEIHLDPRALDFHTAIVGATGTGKSRLVKALVEEVLEKTSYSVVIFDHTGVDYSDPRRWRIAPEVVEGRRIVVHPGYVAKMLSEKMGLSSYNEDLMYYAVMRYVMDVVMFGNCAHGRAGSSEESSGLEEIIERYYEISKKRGFPWSYSEFSSRIADYLEELNCRYSTITKFRMLLSAYVGKNFFDSYLSSRNVVVKDLVRDVVEKRRRFLVIDLSSDIEIVSKRSTVATFLRELWNHVLETRRRVEVLVVIDEAHNYACQRCYPCINELERTAREGRKWGIGLVLATQRIRDLSTDIRNNVNTVFFSRLQVSEDFQELRSWVEGVQNVERVLPMLSTREFFVVGLANPFRKPVLIKVREVA